MNNSYILPVVLGATGSGKSAFGVELAKRLDGEIISADSAQVYRDFSIITARTTEDQMGGIPHHLTGFLDLGSGFSAADFQRLAYSAVEDIRKSGRTPIIVGGTNHYIKAVSEGYTFTPVKPGSKIRETLSELARREGSGMLYRMLAEKDPLAAEKIHPNNLRRIIRALEVIEETGELFSKVSARSENHPLNLKPFYILMDLRRELLYKKIEDRVERMISEGALDEVREVLNRRGRKTLEEARILGVTEILYVLDGLCTLKEGISLIKRNTKRFAKRQLTWIRSFTVDAAIDGENPIEDKGFGEIIERIKGTLRFSGN